MKQSYILKLFLCTNCINFCVTCSVGMNTAGISVNTNFFNVFTFARVLSENTGGKAGLWLLVQS